MAKKAVDPLPDLLFHGIAYLIPGLNLVAQECEISIGEWIILWHIQEGGVPGDQGQATMLRQVLTKLLEQRGFGEANLVRLLNNLEDKSLIRRMSLTQQEREQYRKDDEFFPDSDAGRQAVVLQAAGDEKIKAFKRRLAEHFQSWRLEQNPITRRALDSATGIAREFAMWFYGPATNKSA